MVQRERRTLTNEFKAEPVQLCRVGNRSVDAVARDLDLTPTALRAWVEQADCSPSVTKCPTNFTANRARSHRSQVLAFTNG